MLCVPVIPYGTGAVFESACVVGAGRVGKAVAARLSERIPTRTAGRELDCADAELVVLCVPHRAITEVAAGDPVAGLLGVKPFEIDDEMRPLYHAAASFGSAFLVTLHDVAAELMEAAGAPPEALEPLMRRTIENGFRHPGPPA